MAGSSDKPGSKAEERVSPPASESDQPAADQRQQRGQVEIDDSRVTAAYANFCRVTGTPEELIIDFGLNPHPFGVSAKPIPVTQRIITNFYTAKRMLYALQMSIQRHETTFGVLETDVQKRVRPGAVPHPSGQPPKPPAG